MATSIPFCGACERQYITIPSINWCTECDEGLCSSCQNHHSMSKASQNHHITSIAEYQKLPNEVQQITQICREHDEMYTMYCQKHECACCSSCIVENHVECRKFTKLADIIKNSKDSSTLYEIEQLLQELVVNIQIIRQSRLTNLQTLSEKKQKIEKEMNKKRITINSHLDKIQDDVLKKLNATEMKESKKIKELLGVLNDKENEIIECQRNIGKIKEHASDMQVFVSIKQLEKEVSDKYQFLQSMIDKGKVNDRKLSYKSDYYMDKFEKSFKYFGKIIIKKKLVSDVVLTTQAQRMMSPVFPRSVGTISLKLASTIYTMGKNNIGCCMIPDGRMAFTDYGSGYVRVFRANGVKDFEVKTPSFAFDIAYDNSYNKLIVSSGESETQVITMIDISKQPNQAQVDMDRNIYGITTNDANLIFAAKKGFMLFNYSNHSLSTMIKVKIPELCYVALYDDKICYTNYHTNSVTCIDMEGRVQWTFKTENVLKKPYGISVDNDGYVYVVGFASDNVVVISPDGQQHKEILTTSDGLFKPAALDFNRRTNQLLVANAEKKVMVFTLNRK